MFFQQYKKSLNFMMSESNWGPNWIIFTWVIFYLLDISWRITEKKNVCNFKIKRVKFSLSLTRGISLFIQIQNIPILTFNNLLFSLGYLFPHLFKDFLLHGFKFWGAPVHNVWVFRNVRSGDIVGGCLMPFQCPFFWMKKGECLWWLMLGKWMH